MIPTFELVAHDLLFSSWDRQDANHRVSERWPLKNLFNALYGNMPLWHLTRDIWEEKKEIFKKSYQRISECTRAIAFDEMTDHQWLTPNGLVQMTEWSSGRYVIVNFGSKPVETKDGKTIPPKTFMTFVK